MRRVNNYVLIYINSRNLPFPDDLPMKLPVELPAKFELGVELFITACENTGLLFKDDELVLEDSKPKPLLLYAIGDGVLFDPNDVEGFGLVIELAKHNGDLNVVNIGFIDRYLSTY